MEKLGFGGNANAIMVVERESGKLVADFYSNKDYAQLICACVNACIEINPENPLVVAEGLRGLLINPDSELLEIGRKAIEDVLIEWREGRLSELNRGNGLVVREKDGRDSSIIRFGPETALKIGLKAMGQALSNKG